MCWDKIFSQSGTTGLSYICVHVTAHINGSLPFLSLRRKMSTEWGDSDGRVNTVVRDDSTCITYKGPSWNIGEHKYIFIVIELYIDWSTSIHVYVHIVFGVLTFLKLCKRYITEKSVIFFSRCMFNHVADSMKILLLTYFLLIFTELMIEIFFITILYTLGFFLFSPLFEIACDNHQYHINRRIPSISKATINRKGITWL